MSAKAKSKDQLYSAADLAEGLIREYLTKNGLTNTLKAFDVEQPRQASSVSSRTILRKALGLERLPARLSQAPTTPTLDLWVQYQQLKVAATLPQSRSSSSAEEASTSTAHNINRPQSSCPSQALLHSKLVEGVAEGAAHSTSGPAVQDAIRQHFQQGVLSAARPATSSGQASACLLDQVSTASRGQGHVSNDLEVQDVEGECALYGGFEEGHRPDVMHCDVAGSAPKPPSLPVAHQEMAELRKLMFGSEGGGRQLPWPAWQQGFFFSDRAGLEWGLVQRAGGPCGLLAAMQGHVLAALQGSGLSPLPEHLTAQQQTSALQQALTAAIWQASDGATAVVIHSSCPHTAGLSFDQLCRSAHQCNCGSRSQVEAAVSCHLAQFQEPSGYGIVLLLMSVLATHTVRQTRQDMDESDSCLIAAHGYCSQDLVNLLLTGRAVTNCFDGSQDVAGRLCKGIEQPSQLGFLSLFEWFGYTQVGSYLKSPKLPIWVVCSESHFTVLLAADAPSQRTAASQTWQQFSLLYYDGLANQGQPITLTLSKGPHVTLHKHTVESADHLDKRLVPPLEHVIHTKWSGALCKWNGSDPIL